MAAAVNCLRCSKCRLFKMPLGAKFLFRGVFTSHLYGAASRLPLSRIPSLVFWHKSNLPYRLSLHKTPGNSCEMATLAEIENKHFLKRRLTYFNLLIKLQGLDGVVLDNFCQSVVSASRMMNLEVTKRFNLATENFSQTLAYPPDSYKKHNVTYHFKKHGRIIEIGEVPVEKSDIFIQHLQDNVPVGVSVEMELKKWQDFVSPPDPRYLEQKRLEYERMRERKKKKED